VTWATTVPILVFLGLCSLLRPDVLDLGPVYATDVRETSLLNAPAYGAGHNNRECPVIMKHRVDSITVGY